MSEFFFVLVYVFLLHHGLEYGVVVPESFNTQADCEEAFGNLYGLSPREVTQVTEGELEISGACLHVRRQ